MKTTTKRPLVVLLTLSLLLSVMVPFFAVTVSATETTTRVATDDDKAWYGDGTASTFTISTAGELAYFMELGQQATPPTFSGKTIQLGADIAWNDGYVSDEQYNVGPSGVTYEWEPYASEVTVESSAPSKWFQGTIDGQGYSISGLYMAGTSYQAFICGGSGCKIKNLTLDNVYVDVSENASNTNVFSAALIARTSYTVTITNVSVNGCINGGSTGSVIGGFIAVQTSYNPNGLNIVNCTMDGKIIGNTVLGGFVGANSLAPFTAADCVSYVDISGASAIGGFVGKCCGDATLTKCYNLGTLTASEAATYAGAFLYMDRAKYQYAADSSANLTSSNGTAAISLTDCYYQLTNGAAYALTAYPARGWFTVTTKYGSADSQSYTVDTSKTIFANAKAMNAYVNTLQLAVGDTATVAILGIQMTEVADSKFDIRLVAAINLDGVDTANITQVGFQVRSLGNYSPGTYITPTTVSSVYETITSNYGLSSVSASAFGGDYLYTIVIEDVPASGLKSLVVRPCIWDSGNKHDGAFAAFSIQGATVSAMWSTTPSVTYPAA